MPDRVMHDTGAAAATLPGGGGARRPLPRAVRARLAVNLLFLLAGTTLATWEARLPDMRRAFGIGDATWGLAYTLTIVGELASLSMLAFLIARVSSRRLSCVGAAIIFAVTTLLTWTSSLAVLVVGLFVWGFAANLLSTPMNAQAVVVQGWYRRPLLSSFHACFSIGMLAGGALGVLGAALGVSPGMQMGASNVVLCVLLLLTWRWQPVNAPAEPGHGPERRGWRKRLTPQLQLLAGLALLIAFVENSANQWSALYTTRQLGGGAAASALGAATYTVLSIAIVVGRLGGDRVMARVGRVRFIAISSGAAAAGLGLALALGTPAAALIGFAVLGIGIACVLPTIVSFAGEQSGVSTSEGVWLVETGQQPGFLLAPALIGVLAGAVGLRLALAAVVVAAVGVAVLSRRIRARSLGEGS